LHLSIGETLVKRENITLQTYTIDISEYVAQCNDTLNGILY